MKHRMQLTFPSEQSAYLKRVLLQEKGVPGCSARWEGDALVIEAGDLGDLRAALNSYIRWAHIALEIRNGLKEAGNERH